MLKWWLAIIGSVVAVMGTVFGIVLMSQFGTCADYRFLHVWIPDPSVAVLRDMTSDRDRVRLTSRDLTNQGAKLATRTFKGTSSVLCEELPPASLICEIDYGKLRVLDARTLADTHDINQLVKRALPSAQLGADYANFLVHPDGTFDVPIGEATDARIDLARGTVTSIAVPDRAKLRGGNRARCDGWSDGVVTGGVRWKIDRDTLVRTREVAEAEPAAAEAEIPPVPEPIADAWLIQCPTYKDAIFAISHNEAKSQLARLDEHGQARWIVNLEAHPDDVFALGDWLLVTTGTSARRLIAIDLQTGAIRWVAG